MHAARQPVATGAQRPSRVAAARLLTLAFALSAGLLLCHEAAAQAGESKPASSQGSLLILVQPLWSELTPFQRETLAPL
ncbi:MAG TPA: hypothetical protein PK359_10700, partial [Burkholderiaceae bacterium]|nr:hypothetical protein [Burkholderiaceae bacterium]